MYIYKQPQYKIPTNLKLKKKKKKHNIEERETCLRVTLAIFGPSILFGFLMYVM